MFGQAFIELFKNYPDVERFAICDLRKDRVEYWAKKYGICETYSSLDDICRSDIESLAIITQPWLHDQQAIKAMKAVSMFTAQCLQLSQSKNATILSKQ